LLWFYSLAAVTLAPTPDQVAWLQEKLRRPSFLMPRGVDSEQFHPKHRTVKDQTLRLGFVGRVTPEKGVRVLPEVEKALEAAGVYDFRIVIAGDGSEVAWLKARLKHSEFTGVLRGEELARAYANMNLLVFPSRTDTFGNVVQEAAASGVPAVVTNQGGPQHLVVAGATGYVAQSDEEFIARVLELASAPALLERMGMAAREKVSGVSWDAAFGKTYAAYDHAASEKGEGRATQSKMAMVKS